jgi:hypothetical protein
MSDANAILRDRRFWPFYVRINGDPLDDDVLRHFDKVTILPYFLTVNLGLHNTKTGATQEMGWWDDARWHPFTLRWPELLALHSFWLDQADFGLDPGAAFLLLAIFVGHGVDERDSFPNRKDVIREHYKRFQLFSDSELTALVDKTLALPTEDDYHWKRDEELGWLFSGEYPCYSIRNREHSDGSEGRFPFSEWSSIVDRLSPPNTAK